MIGFMDEIATRSRDLLVVWRRNDDALTKCCEYTYPSRIRFLTKLNDNPWLTRIEEKLEKARVSGQAIISHTEERP